MLDPRLLAMVALAGCAPTVPSAHQPASKVEIAGIDVLPGDLVFRRGSSLHGRAVLLADRASRFSHVGLVVTGRRIVHAVPATTGGDDGGVISEPLSVFLDPENAREWAVLRLLDPASGRLAEATAYAASLVARDARFDGDFDLDDDREIYCTELVWRAYREAGIDLAGGRFDRARLPLGQRVAVLLPSRLEQSFHLRLVASSSQDVLLEPSPFDNPEKAP